MKLVDGKQVAEDGETISVARDGQTVRVPIMLMDSRPAPAFSHKPGFIAVSDAERAALDVAHVVRDKKLSEAWRNPPPVDQAQTTVPKAPTTVATLTSDQRYAARDSRLETAWRNP
jgi:hypothetical protein